MRPLLASPIVRRKGRDMISQTRMAHQFAVAIRIVELAAEHGTYSKEELDELFVMGYLHDIGYQFANDPDSHAQAGGEVLKRLGVKYWHEVANHGNPYSSFSSRELDLLNAADMSTSPQGESVSFAERLADIGARYGTDSTRYVNANLLIKQLMSKGF